MSEFDNDEDWRGKEHADAKKTAERLFRESLLDLFTASLGYRPSGLLTVTNYQTPNYTVTDKDGNTLHIKK